MKKVFLHLGTHKTGTSFLQSVLRRNAAALMNIGVRPVVGGESNPFLEKIDRNVITTRWMNDTSNTVVFSNENLVVAENSRRFGLARELRDAVIEAGGDVTIVFYLRPAVEWLPSMWAQYVKIGARQLGVLSFDEFLDSFTYESVLEMISVLRSEGDTIVRPYVRSLMKNESIFDDFFDAIGVPLDGAGVKNTESSVNSTPSRRQIELARVYNAHRPSGPVAHENHVELLNSFLRTRHSDPTPSVAATVTKTQLQKMSDRYADAETELTDGLVDSRLTLSDQMAKAPDAYEAAVPDDAADQYLQNMMILSKIHRNA